MRLSQLYDYPIDQIEHKGSLQAWTEAANRLFGPGCEAQACALLASFGSPLVSLFRGPDGGILYSAFGGPKSGKSVALCAAGSVWAVPSKLNFDSKMRDDRLTFLTDLGNLPAIRTGFLNYDPGRTGTFLREVFIGKYAQGEFWRGSMLSFSGAALFPLVKEARASLPILGVEAKLATPKHVRVEHLEYAFTENWGNACIPYLKYLRVPEVRKWARQMTISHFARLRDEYGLITPHDDQASRFQRRALAIMHVAGLIANKLELMDFSVDRISSWAADQTLVRPQEPKAPPPPSLPLPESQANGQSDHSEPCEDDSRSPEPPSQTPMPQSPAEST